jgi:hypothetical protein
MKILLALVILVSGGLASAREPIANLESFEKELKTCLVRDVKKAKCIATILAPRAVPHDETFQSGAPQLDDLLAKWLADDTVFAVHNVDQRQWAGIIDKRTYLIEDTTGSLMLFTVTYRNVLGKWYVSNCNLSSKPESLEKMMGEV